MKGLLFQLVFQERSPSVTSAWGRHQGPGMRSSSVGSVAWVSGWTGHCEDPDLWASLALHLLPSQLASYFPFCPCECLLLPWLKLRKSNGRCSRKEAGILSFCPLLVISLAPGWVPPVNTLEALRQSSLGLVIAPLASLPLAWPTGLGP